MNEIDRFKRLAAAAAREEPPRLDVTGRVLARIAPGPRPRALETPLAVFSGAAVLAASIAVVVALHAWAVFSDPLGGLFQPLTMVMR